MAAAVDGEALGVDMIIDLFGDYTSSRDHATGNGNGGSGSDAAEVGLLSIPPEILLHILSYLDLPDLALLARLSPTHLAPLTADPILHLHRRRYISPSRVDHQLFGRSKEGHALRPTVGELVQRGVMKGLGIERRWRMGGYFYSLSSIMQYENSKSLSRRHAQHVLSVQLRRRAALAAVGYSHSAALSHSIPITATSSATAYTGAAFLKTLHSTHIMPDIECSSPFVARSLLPVMRKLKWSLQKDRLAKVLKTSGVWVGVGRFLEEEDLAYSHHHPHPHNNATGSKGMRRKVIVPVEGEKFRLAVCPDMKKRVGFYEGLGSK